MNWKSFFDNPEELFISGLCASVFLYWVIGWWVIPVFFVNAFLWRYGGWEHGNKLARRVGVPIVVCGVSMLFGVGWAILLAGPFMVWLAPSYGEKSWLFKVFKEDFPTRFICFTWYWTAYLLAFLVSRF